MGLRTPLTPDEVQERLAQHPGWTGDATRIERIFDLEYDISIGIVTQVGQAAIELEHRPDIDIRWGTLRFAMTTHTAGEQVTDLDFLLAERIDHLAADFGATAPDGTVSDRS